MFWEPLSCCSYCCMRGARALTCCFMIFFLYSLFLSWSIWDFVFFNSFYLERVFVDLKSSPSINETILISLIALNS
jgi:hypothetical protein